VVIITAANVRHECSLLRDGAPPFRIWRLRRQDQRHVCRIGSKSLGLQGIAAASVVSEVSAISVVPGLPHSFRALTQTSLQQVWRSRSASANLLVVGYLGDCFGHRGDMFPMYIDFLLFRTFRILFRFDSHKHLVHFDHLIQSRCSTQPIPSCLHVANMSRFRPNSWSHI
jgi:hypothetical protein